MKTILWMLLLPLLCYQSKAQVPADRSLTQTFPITVGVFSESVSLGFAPLFTHPHPGLKIGTELYYRNRPGSQLFQTANLGGYYHKGLHSAFFLDSEFGYRKLFYGAFVEVMAGIGYMAQYTAWKRYQETTDGTFVKASPLVHRFIPSLALGVGYTIKKRVSVYVRYGIMAEVPFGYKGIPLLPHETFLLGVRVPLANK